jgi:hypothetical protein
MTIDLTRDEIWFLKALRAAGERGRIVTRRLGNAQTFSGGISYMPSWDSASWALALLAASRDHAGAATAYQFCAESLFTCSIEQVNFVHFGRFATFMP